MRTGGGEKAEGMGSEAGIEQACVDVQGRPEMNKDVGSCVVMYLTSCSNAHSDLVGLG